MKHTKICAVTLATVIMLSGCNSTPKDSSKSNSTNTTTSATSSEIITKEITEMTENNPYKRPANFVEYADWAQDNLIEKYWNIEQNFMNNAYPYDPKNDALNYWWKAHAVDAMVDGYERTKDEKYADIATKIVKGIISRQGSLYNEFYDDMEWLALACLRLYDLNGDEKMKEYAVKLWNDIKTAWWDDELGGLGWKKGDEKVNRNACSNGPGMLVAARLYQRFGDEEDLAWAKKIYEFQKKNLVNPDTGVVYDGLRVEKDGSINTNKDWLFTYNFGTYIGGATELYVITKDEAYLKEAEKTAGAAMDTLTTVYGVLKSEGNGDGGMFKGILIRYLLRLYEVNGDKEIADYILKNASKLTKDGAAPDVGLFGPEWNKFPSTPLDLTCQLSGVFLIEAAARLETK